MPNTAGRMARAGIAFPASNGVSFRFSGGLNTSAFVHMIGTKLIRRREIPISAIMNGERVRYDC